MICGYRNIVDENSTLHHAEELIPHPFYIEGLFKYDIGLIKLRKNIVFGPRVQAIKLPSSDNIDHSYPAVATGWGRIEVRSGKRTLLLKYLNEYLNTRVHINSQL